MKTMFLHALFLLLFMALVPLSSRGQSNNNPPGQISYQGFVTDANGIPLATNKPVNYTVYFRIYSTSSGATNVNVLWGEKQVVTIDRGYFTVMLGSGSQIKSGIPSGDLSAIFVGGNASDRYLGILVVGVGNPPAEIAPRLRLLASPYSLLSRSANSLVASNGTVLINSSGSAINVSGPLSATSLAGDGSALTALNADNISSGTVNKLRLPALAAGDISGGTFAASQIPSLDAGKITTGTLADARLSSNIPLISGGNTFSGDQIVSSGHVGIGTGSPNGQLEVRDAGTDTVLRVTSNFNNSEVIQFWRAATPQTGWQAGSVNRDFNITYMGGSSTNSFLTINKDSGRIGLGTDSPGAPLHVVGNNTSALRIADKNHGYWDLYTDDSSTNLLLSCSTGAGGHFRSSDASYFSPSDISLKKDVNEMGNVLDRILQLRPVSYRMKSSAESARPSIGFIAQEVEPLFPEVVETFDGIKGLAYAHFAPITVEAIQEINRKLETKLSDKDRELGELRSQLNELKEQQKLENAKYDELKRMVEKLAEKK